jgi:hypothetical protein
MWIQCSQKIIQLRLALLVLLRPGLLAHRLVVHEFLPSFLLFQILCFPILHSKLVCDSDEDTFMYWLDLLPLRKRVLDHVKAFDSFLVE